jgi:hypothetical protein
MTICNVPGCPCEAERGYPTCRPHRLGRRARQLGIITGPEGEKCVRCQRNFKPDDFVLVGTTDTLRRRKPVLGHVHVQCGPGKPKRTPMPLLEGL